MKEYTDQELRNLIIERFTKPHHFGTINDSEVIYLPLESPTCSDKLNLSILLVGGKIQTLKFDGQACAISVSAADLLIDQVLGKTTTEALKIIENYYFLIQNDSQVDWELLAELVAFRNIYRQKGRITCATLFSNGLKKLLLENQK